MQDIDVNPYDKYIADAARKYVHLFKQTKDNTHPNSIFKVRKQLEHLFVLIEKEEQGINPRLSEKGDSNE